MVDITRTRMEDMDWRKYGHSREDYYQGRLPTKRLIIPLPEDNGGIKNLFYVFNTLAAGMERALKHKHTPTAMMVVVDEIKGAQITLYDHKEAWEDGLRDRLAEESRKSEQLGNVVRLGQSD